MIFRVVAAKFAMKAPEMVRESVANDICDCHGNLGDTMVCLE
jgi:hypothetical protein